MIFIMKHTKLNRRTFFTIYAGALAAGILDTGPGSSALAQSKPESDRITVPELELVGKQRPPLFGQGFNLRKPAAKAFERMCAEAKRDGIHIYSYSSYRNFDHQKRIWNRKYQLGVRQKMKPIDNIHSILRYSTLPGTSRHHWGTDCDLIDRAQPEPPDPLHGNHFTENGVYFQLYHWLWENAEKYGFYEVYTNDPRRTGFAYEPWHWSYAELSIPFLHQFHTVLIKKYLDSPDISGRNHLTNDFLKRYVREWGFGVNPELIPSV
ncbi:MAG: D-alanyl-D-alanine carboxypeptidase family protein [Candidatus Omnitrophota bacterium]|jgi:LAS superfamily LD-carboxypeptidase LdcB|nr:MAG: D-alanyl-D-alanine carboxypeptidase family protein [Candidatus Omnitrophota bacterium]